MMIKNMEKTIPYLKECDLIIHAGDNFTDSRYIHSMTNVGIIAVKGNCDFDAVEKKLSLKWQIKPYSYAMEISMV
ncbi:calcineurin-like phosphoesterase superfamily domain protein [Clostridioides difficile CD51]|nr:calcineurin-like phosphoesterase superfamily domain protein [Clostridioides difficile CD51]